MQNSDRERIRTFNFPEVERKVFKKNFLETVVIELRYPTYLRLNEGEPLQISESIRGEFPLYEQSSEMQVTPLGTTKPHPVYKFTTRQEDPVLEISASNIVLATQRYRSFDVFSSHIDYLIKNVIPHLDTTFFTRIGLRYMNKVSGIQQGGTDVLDWINNSLIAPVAGGEIGTISNMKSELTGQFDEGYYTFRFGLSPPSHQSNERSFLLDWDYYREDVEVQECLEYLKAFHDVHFPFFWWALGEKAKKVLENEIKN